MYELLCGLNGFIYADYYVLKYKKCLPHNITYFKIVCILLKNSFLKCDTDNKKWRAVYKILVRYIASICVYQKKPTSGTKMVQIILLIKCALISVTSLVAQTVKRLPIMRETQVQSLGWEDLLEKEMATHSSTLAWKIPWTEDPGRLQSMGSRRVGHNWVTSLHALITVP